MEMTIVQSQEQLEQCFEVRIKVFVEEQKVPREEELDEYDASPESCRHLLITEQGKPVATGRWKVLEPGVAKLQRIAVLSEYRSHGLGRQVVEGLVKDAREAGMTSAILDAQCTAEGFYARLGFQTVSPETFYDAGILHVRMAKAL